MKKRSNLYYSTNMLLICVPVLLPLFMTLTFLWNGTNFNLLYPSLFAFISKHAYVLLNKITSVHTYTIWLLIKTEIYRICDRFKEVQNFNSISFNWLIVQPVNYFPFILYLNDQLYSESKNLIVIFVFFFLFILSMFRIPKIYSKKWSWPFYCCLWPQLWLLFN